MPSCQRQFLWPHIQDNIDYLLNSVFTKADIQDLVKPGPPITYTTRVHIVSQNAVSFIIVRLIGLLVILDCAAIEDDMTLTNSTNGHGLLLLKPLSSNTSIINYGPATLRKITLHDGYTDLYFSLIITGCVVMSFQSVTLPTLGGDQYKTCDDEVSFLFHFNVILSYFRNTESIEK